MYAPCVVFTALVAVCHSLSPPQCTDRPIIGILTQPTEGVLAAYGTSTLHAGFVKWVEASGMRAVPLPFDAPKQTLVDLAQSVNGILLMGGPTDIIVSQTAYYTAAQTLYTVVTDLNSVGDYFPLWGTCLGLELLAIIASQNFTLMGNTSFASTNVSLPLYFTSIARSSQLFGSAPSDILEKLATMNVTDNEHHNAVTPQEFIENPNLAATFNILSTSRPKWTTGDRDGENIMLHDLQGREFVSTMEAKHFPIYSTQWHPERTLFEWYKYQNTNHNLEAVQCAQYTGNFFASEARKNCHHFPSSKEERSALIYNYSPVYTMAITGGSYEQMYFFGKQQN